ncbi:hypothetical protein Kpol_526p32 [Vanderwaltozyma polyspora DSM 70294]|uniref:Palmitoyltransferase n=1 Tax=Vanderwaltozyma polyspora (strain ATCC 22028 / DSM 70294 / BCRC 21397 / CBS 2163 / NBRC 10782 / NRRL Y-8283 / UCD 57-17) TaxID=436907 RepID=A7TLT7_VANPO|nr:uncharacterized protein Kpol_526p32 [Vanderwaltozyma polyspora DSM 70294]EDO16779.1 hypothetical protein Kpol_526p32 [Vanderwaltozyma polyspora DSM 70294]
MSVVDESPVESGLSKGSTEDGDNISVSSMVPVISGDEGLDGNGTATGEMDITSTNKGSQNSEVVEEVGLNSVVSEQEDPILLRYRAACQSGDLATVKDLIENELVDINNDYDSNENVTGLHWASVNNKLAIAEYLISKGADVNKKAGTLNATPLHWAASYGYVYIVDVLLKNGADPTITDDQGFNLLHLSINSSNIMLILYVLYFVVDKGIIDVNCTDPNGRTPLLWAAYQGDSLSVNSLLKFNASTKLTDSSGFTPLHWGVVKGQPHVLKYLIADGADFFQKTNDGKDCFTIAQEMNTVYSLKEALNHCGFNDQGFPIKRYIKKSLHAKLVTFFTPWIALGFVFAFFAYVNPLIAILVTALMSLAIAKALRVFALPYYTIKGAQANTLLKSPLLAGIFAASVFWLSINWLFTVMPYTIAKHSFGNFVMLSIIISLSYLFVNLVRSDPGTKPAEFNHDSIRETITNLMLIGKFDTNNFCIESSVRKPLRSRYSYLNSAIVTRFDHFCPWIYNDIGLKNHKLFVLFIILMVIGIWEYTYLAMEYFDELEDLYKDASCFLLGDDELCAGLTYGTFTFFIMIWSLFQSIWVSILIFVQTFQMFKGVTSYEFSKIVKGSRVRNPKPSRVNDTFNTTPDGYTSGNDAENSATDAAASTLQPESRTGTLETITPSVKKSRTFCALCSAVLGFDQWIIIMKESLGISSGGGDWNRSSFFIPTNYGWKTNLTDFWLTSDTTAPIWQRVLYPPCSSKALLNNIEVDYNNLYRLPDTFNTESPDSMV